MMKMNLQLFAHKVAPNTVNKRLQTMNDLKPLRQTDYSASTGTIETCFLSRPFLVNLTTPSVSANNV